MSRVNFEQLLEAGVHFGHLKRKWNPAMAPYIFMERNGIHIIDLHKTVAKVDEAAVIMQGLVRQGKKVLFVATKKQAKEVVAEKAAAVGMPYVTERWPGGMLTNFPTIRKAIKKMGTIDKMTKDGTYSNLSKRERLQIARQRAKLEKTFGSIAELNRLPSALFVVDVLRERIAVREAIRLGIPVFGMVDTNSNPNEIDHVIPANDDATKSIEVIMEAMCNAIKEGLSERKAEKVDMVAAGEGEAEDAAPKERRVRIKKDRELHPKAEESSEPVAKVAVPTPKKVVAPKAAEAPKSEAPKATTPKVEAPKAETPKEEVKPKVEAPKVEAPKEETPKEEVKPKAEAPKAETTKEEAKPKKPAKAKTAAVKTAKK